MKYQEIRDLIDKGKQFRTDKFKSRADKYVGWYNARYVDKQGKVIVYRANVTYSTIRTIVASLYAGDPDFSINIGPDTSDPSVANKIKQLSGIDIGPDDFDTLAIGLEEGLKLTLSKVRIKKIIKNALRNALLMGLGVVKVGYKIDLKDKETFKLRKKHKQLLDACDSGNTLIKEYPFIVNIDPRSMLFPPDAMDFDQLEWQCQEKDVDADYIKDIYNVELDPLAVGNSTTNQMNENKITMYEFHSMSEPIPKIYILADGYSEIINEQVHPLFNPATGDCDNMFKYLWFNDNPEALYPISDIEYVNDQILECNIAIERRTQFIHKMRAMYLLKGQWDENQIRKWESGEDLTFIENMNNDGSVDVLPMPTLGNEFYSHIKYVQSEILEILGMTDYSMGGATQHRKATEAAFVEQGRKTRVEERMDIIEDFVNSQVKTLLDVMKEYQCEPQLFGFRYNDQQIQMRMGAELLGLTNMQVQVVKGSTVGLDRPAQLRQVQQLVSLGQTFAPVANIVEIYKEALRSLGYKNYARFIKQGGPNPVQANQQGSVPVPGEMPNQIQQQNGGMPQ